MSLQSRKSSILKVNKGRLKSFWIRKRLVKHSKEGNKLKTYTGKDLFLSFSMGIIKKAALGPNPLSVRKPKDRNNDNDSLLKKRRKRSGKRSKLLSAQKRLKSNED